MSSTIDGSTISSIVTSHENSLSQVSVKAVVIQLVLMTSISVCQVCSFDHKHRTDHVQTATILAFSFFRPREKKVYAPKVRPGCVTWMCHWSPMLMSLQIKYQLPAPSNPFDDPDYEPPPPAIPNGFFAWFSPVIRLKEEQMIANIGQSRVVG